VIFTGLSNSIPYDFFIKVINKTNITDDLIDMLPFFSDVSWHIKSRVLRLNCLTEYYSELWQKCFESKFVQDQFTKKDKRLSKWDHLQSEWTYDTPLRNFFERRQAHVELDVLVAMELDISLEALIAIYRIQFPILSKNEKATWYDQKGKIVYSISTSCSSLNRKDVLESWDGKSTDPIDGYVPPFTICDREADIRQAYHFFKVKIESEES